MADRFWVGNGGNINDTAHWSTTSGGASGASVPTIADRALWDANSFTLAGQTVAMNVAFNCLDMIWTGATNSPTLSGTGVTLTINGSLTTILAMTFNLNSNAINFTSTTTGKTVTTNGLSFTGNSQINFNGVGGGWTLQDNLTTAGAISLFSGTLVTNSKSINCTTFGSSSTLVRTLTLGSSVITLSNDWDMQSTTNLTLTAHTSSITLTGAASIFYGGGQTFNNVTFTGTTTTIVASNTIGTLTLTVGKTLKLTSGTIQTITSLVANGTPASKITIQSVTAGSAATLSKSSGVLAIRNITLKDITATGGATFYALGTTNVSGNTGWAFQMLIKQEKLSGTEMALYHIDSSGVMQKVSG